MDARPLALAAGVVLATLLFVWVERDLSRLDASIAARVIAGAAFAAMAAAWLAVFTVQAPVALAWLATGAALLVTVAHKRLAALRFGRSPEAQLAAEVGAIRASLSTLTTSRRERALVRAQLVRLDRWRDRLGGAPDVADELIDLVRQDVNDRLDWSAAGSNGHGHDDRRERRIRELLEELEEVSTRR